MVPGVEWVLSMVVLGHQQERTKERVSCKAKKKGENSIKGCVAAKYVNTVNFFFGFEKQAAGDL